MRFDIWYIALALLMLVIGEGFGQWMAGNDHSLALVHAHLNVIAWVSFALFGLIHRAYPALAGSPFAFVQFLLTVFSSVFFVAGLWVVMIAGDGLGALLGSYALMASSLLFVVMFFTKVVFASERGQP